MKFDLFKDIVERTEGDIYLGVVGPVRTGKSTFIKKFMEKIVLPSISKQSDKDRAIDELPQSSAGRTIMTTEPKFVPDEAVEVTFKDNVKMRVRLVDCVGYAVPDALGYEDEKGARMVTTPWFEDPIPFEEAARVGTDKVINEHSTIGIVITTDGSITDIPRDSYIEAEQQVIDELKEIGKPFVIILNTTRPTSKEVDSLKSNLMNKYEVPVLPVNCQGLAEEDIENILNEVLYEFPVQEFSIKLPSWVEVLDFDHWLRKNFNDAIKENVADVNRLREVDEVVLGLKNYDFVEEASLKDVNLGTGQALINITSPQELYNDILSEICGEEIEEEGDLLNILKEFSKAKKEFDKIAEALEEVDEFGYGVVPPLVEEMELEEPEIIRQGGKFGVRLKASAPALHMIKVNVTSEFSPIVGTEKQSEDLANYIMEEFEENPEKIWDSNIFGKSLYDLVEDGISSKLTNMPPDAQKKLQQTLEKIINEGKGGLIAIIL